jgi:hypothetical protein
MTAGDIEETTVEPIADRAAERHAQEEQRGGAGWIAHDWTPLRARGRGVGGSRALRHISRL